MTFTWFVFPFAVPLLLTLSPLLAVPFLAVPKQADKPEQTVVLLAAEPEKTAAKALAATGWDKRKSDHSTWKDKGVIHFEGQTMDYTSETHFTSPDKYRWKMAMKVNGADLDLTVVVNGDKAWEAGTGKTQELGGNKLEYILSELHQINVLSLKPLLDAKQFTLKSVEDATVDGKRCVGIAAEKAGKPTVKIWFDAESGLPAKLECKVKNEFDNWKEATDEMYLNDWIDDDGVRHFRKMKVHRNGKLMIDATCSDFKQPDKVDPKLYEKP